jgi:hypothetical protein
MPGGTISGGKNIQPFEPVITAFHAEVAFGSLLQTRLRSHGPLVDIMYVLPRGSSSSWPGDLYPFVISTCIDRKEEAYIPATYGPAAQSP